MKRFTGYAWKGGIFVFFFKLDPNFPCICILVINGNKTFRNLSSIEQERRNWQLQTAM